MASTEWETWVPKPDDDPYFTALNLQLRAFKRAVANCERFRPTYEKIRRVSEHASQALDLLIPIDWDAPRLKSSVVELVVAQRNFNTAAIGVLWNVWLHLQAWDEYGSALNSVEKLLEEANQNGKT